MVLSGAGCTGPDGSPGEAARAGRVDPQQLRRCLGEYPTGVAVVTYQAEGGPRGATVNSFTSVSLDPPLVLVSFGRETNAARLLGRRAFTVNVLAATQRDLALHFAGYEPGGLDIPWSAPGCGPRLRGGVAWLRCQPWATHDAGDHLLFIGRVTGYDTGSGEPLLFHRGQFRPAGACDHPQNSERRLDFT